MDQAGKAAQFRAMHQPGAPVVLYNIWDAGSAQAVARGGARALATGSWSVAAAQGFEDGEAMPLVDVLRVVRRIIARIELPLTVDFEGGYAADPAGIMANVGQLLETGAIGLNFEDQIVQGSGLYPVADQVTRLRAARRAAELAGIPAFLNARTDLFLNSPCDGHAALMEQAILRAGAYAEAGADGFFAPGLNDAVLIADLARRSPLPLNVMAADPCAVTGLAQTGVARISFGPAPWLKAMEALTREAGSLARLEGQTG